MQINRGHPPSLAFFEQDSQAESVLEDVLVQAKTLVDELEPINQAQSQFTTRVTAVASLATASVLSLIAAFGYFRGLKEVAHPLVSFLASAVLLLISTFLFRRPSTSEKTALVITVVILCLTVITVWFNGVFPLYFLPVILIFLHCVAPPNLALLSGFLVLVMAGLVFFTHPSEIEFRVASRVLAAGIICLGFFQLLMRQNRRVYEASAYITKRLQALAGSLENDLSKARVEKKIAEVTDADSGLLNRSGFREKLSAKIKQSYETRPWAVVSIKFPSSGLRLNAEMVYGSEEVIALLISRLKTIFDSDLIARSSKWGFIGVADIGESQEEFLKSMTRQLEALSGPLLSASDSAALPVYVGLSCWPDTGASADELSSQAERAMSHAIDMGLLQQPIWYSEKIESIANSKKEIVTSLLTAFEQNQFELYYQPVVSAEGGPVIKAEALVRWNHPVRGLLPPGSFLSLVETHGYMGQLTHYCLQAAARTVHDWRQSIHPQFEISVNVSPAYLAWGVQRREEILDFFKSLKVEAGAIKLEITEESLLQVTSEILKLLSDLKKEGFLLALDDFGSGYSSFSRLEALPLDSIKIDKTLVDHIENSPKKLRVCSAIIHLGHDFELDVVVEGVESARQKDLLQEAGCDFIQGYLYSKPLPKTDFESYCARLGRF